MYSMLFKASKCMPRVFIMVSDSGFKSNKRKLNYWLKSDFRNACINLFWLKSNTTGFFFIGLMHPDNVVRKSKSSACNSNSTLAKLFIGSDKRSD